MKFYFHLIICFLLCQACATDDAIIDPVDPENPSSLYFPPIGSTTWETIETSTLAWDEDKIAEFKIFLEESNTRAFLVLKDGKIVIEEYFGENLAGQEFTVESNWYWASAGKSLAGTLAGIAQENGILDIEESSATYLGHGWSSMSESQEDAVLVRHHLSMTTGLDDRSVDVDCTDPECLFFLTEPGTRWAYHNGPYTLTDQIIAGAAKSSFNEYFNSALRDPIGMEGEWIYLGFNHVYFSTARSMARFGLLTLNKGLWNNEVILGDQAYFEDMINTSQEKNKSYGYLWWLNGKSSHMLPGLQFVFPTMLAPNAPEDMIVAAGKNGQLLNIIPSKNMVVVRMGDNPDNSLVPTKYQNELWEHLSKVGF